MITEDYVSFEIAKLLKEKGFDEICRAVYVIRDERLVHCTRHNIFDFTNNERIKEVGDGDTAILAPTLQMTMKWLREIHHCVICITPLTFYCGENVNSWGYNIWAGDNLEVDEENTPKFTTYEEACEAAIKYCLESLI